tara:strand:+ start:682 stop:1107 length:426 start_codon:yes stop_codon:yes gene_type:complete
MRIQYYFTSAIEDVPSKIAYQIRSFSDKHKIDKSLMKLVKGLGRNKPSYTNLQIEHIREKLAELDLLLQESSEILQVCQQAKSGTFVEEPAEKEPQPPQKTNHPLPPEKPEGKQETMQLQAAMSGIENIASTLKAMRNNNE